MAEEVWVRRGGQAWLSFPSLQEMGALAAFSTRQGGISGYPFSSLNLAVHTGDREDAVRRNRTAWAEALEVDPARLTAPAQVHGSRVTKVGADVAGRGVLDGRPLEDCDALITCDHDIYLTAFFADCAPVFLVDPGRRALGLAHAGWRGAAGQVALNTLQAMHHYFGTRPEHCLAVVGPAIGPCCYQVGDEVVQALRGTVSSLNGLAEPAGSSWRIDLKGIVARQLAEAGIHPERLVVSRSCTCCRPDLFYSYRRDGRTGRMAALLGWRKAS